MTTAGSREPKKIRVLLVDDSAVARFALNRMLASDPGIEVTGEARNGEQALRMVSKSQPDLVLMDITMEGMDGLTATENIMRTDPRPVIIISDHVGRRADINFEALQAGALEVIAKPTAQDITDEAAHRRLQRLVRLAAEVPVVTRRRTLRPPRSGVGSNDPAAAMAAPAGDPPASVVAERPPVRRPASLICIGASTGGPPALSTLFAALGPAPNCPVLVVQHISPTFTDGLVRWLAQSSGMPVELATNGSVPRPGTVYLAPGDLHMELRDGRLLLSSGPPESGHRPSVDLLFESVARSSLVTGSLAVLLTGMGRDGARGLKAIRAAGGRTIAQDQASSVVYGMPKAAAEIGAAGEILPLNAIADQMADSVVQTLSHRVRLEG